MHIYRSPYSVDTHHIAYDNATRGMNMAPNYGIHTPDDDSYYYCCKNDCACHKTPHDDDMTTEDDYKHFDNLFSTYNNRT